MYAKLNDVLGTMTHRLKTLLPDVSNPENFSLADLEAKHGIVEVERVYSPLEWYQTHGDPVVDTAPRPVTITYPAVDQPLAEVRAAAPGYVHMQRVQQIEESLALMRMLTVAQNEADPDRQFPVKNSEGELIWMNTAATINYVMDALNDAQLDDAADLALQAEAATIEASTPEELARIATWPSAWVAPTGAHDAYAKNQTVKHGGNVWVSLIDANVWEPGVSGWRNITQPTVGYPAWVQPTGGHDAYQIGDRVTHAEQNWESEVADNVWEPGAYGWVVV